MSLMATEPAELDAIRDEVVAAAVRGAKLWVDRKTWPEPTVALAELGRMAGVVALSRARLLSEQPPALNWFVEALERPIGEMLPGQLHGLGDDNAVLVSGGRLTGEALDLFAESTLQAFDADEPSVGWMQIRTEQVERRLFVQLIAGGQGTYADARKSLIRHPTGTEREFADRWNSIGWRPPADSLVDVPADARIGAWWFPCPVCRWPMTVALFQGSATGVACSFRPHANAGARFRVVAPGGKGTASRSEDRPPALLSAGRRKAPVGLRVDGLRVLARPVWRYITVPGLTELSLATRLRELPGTEVTMWPDLDRVDLLVHRAGQTWEADVKDYADPLSLVRTLLARHPGAPSRAWLVVPEYRRSQLPELQERLPGWKVCGTAQFQRMVRRTGETEAAK